MAFSEQRNWYLIRTKAGEERRVEQQIGRFAAERLLPLVKVRVRRWNRSVESVGPLFPCYLFALFDFERDYVQLRYTGGLTEIVCFGGEPAVAPEWLIGELKERCERGPVELPERRFLPGEPVTVVDGPLRELEGIFERHLSGIERVGILLRTMGREVRATLPATMVVPLGVSSVQGNAGIQNSCKRT